MSAAVERMVCWLDLHIVLHRAFGKASYDGALMARHVCYLLHEVQSSSVWEQFARCPIFVHMMNQYPVSFFRSCIRSATSRFIMTQTLKLPLIAIVNLATALAGETNLGTKMSFAQSFKESSTMMWVGLFEIRSTFFFLSRVAAQ